VSGAARGRIARLLPAASGGARRTPFVLLVVVLLSSGLIGLLLLNSSLNQGSFELSRLQKRTKELTDQQQELQQDVDRLSAPDALERRAHELGMVPGGDPVFLTPDGKVLGSPSPAGSAPEPLSARIAGPVPGSATPAASPSPAAPQLPSVPQPLPIPGR
jgi:cell division protein FtsB